MPRDLCLSPSSKPSLSTLRSLPGGTRGEERRWERLERPEHSFSRLSEGEMEIYEERKKKSLVVVVVVEKRKASQNFDRNEKKKKKKQKISSLSFLSFLLCLSFFSRGGRRFSHLFPFSITHISPLKKKSSSPPRRQTLEQAQELERVAPLVPSLARPGRRQQRREPAPPRDQEKQSHGPGDREEAHVGDVPDGNGPQDLRRR